DLVATDRPALAYTGAAEQLEIGTLGVRFDPTVELLRLAAVLARRLDDDLADTGRQPLGWLAAAAEYDIFGVLPGGEARPHLEDVVVEDDLLLIEGGHWLDPDEGNGGRLEPVGAHDRGVRADREEGADDAEKQVGVIAEVTADRQCGDVV